MADIKRTARIAIVGMGPRGLGALEALAERCGPETPRLQIDIFDPAPSPGAGPNFDPAEPRYCLLNTPYRAIAIRPPKGASIGGFAQWQEGHPDPDHFPPRAALGRYLEARLADLLRHGFARPEPAIQFLRAPVQQIIREGDAWRLHSAAKDHGLYDEVLLTLGQPPVHPDEQLARWQDHAAKSKAALMPAYPARALCDAVAAWQGKRVAIRGLGLSTYDVLRGLTLAQGGVFASGHYHPSGREPERILPFSLNGQPPFPKPETQVLDATFSPTEAETTAFTEAATKAVAADPDAASALLSEALVAPVARILTAQNTPALAVHVWLAQEWEAPGSQEDATPLDALTEGIEMARGAAPPSIGYALGQVWRKWQDPWRRAFNPGNASPATAKRLVGFDEGLKRYSYGPPLTSAKELRALVAAGVVDLSCASDPHITSVPEGWRLESAGSTLDVSVMIDAVLPTPNLAQLADTLLPGLKARGHLTALLPDLGAATAPDGRLYDARGNLAPGLCLLGRLALGSVTAVDSLHDCFGQSADRWSDGVVDRLTRRRPHRPV